MKKPTLILVHGFRGTHKGLLAIADCLRDDFTVLTPDIPGSGDNPELDNKTLDGYAEWFHNYIKEKKLKKPYIVGHSMGSIIIKFCGSKFLSYAISHFLTADKSQQKRIDELHFLYSGKFASAASFMADCSISMHEQTVIPEGKNVMLCYGEKDRLTKHELTESVAEKYHLDHHRFDGAGHLINYERAEQVAAEIRKFLKK